MLPSVSVPTPTAPRLAAIARPGAGARSAGVAIEHVRILRLSAARAPARRRSRRSEVGPLAQVGLAEDDGACRAHPRDGERIALRPVVCQRQRARGVHHAGGVDVVLDEHRDAVQRPAQLAGRALVVERVGVLERRGFESITALTFGPASSTAAMRSRYACVSACDVRVPAAIRASASVALSSTTSTAGEAAAGVAVADGGGVDGELHAHSPMSGIKSSRTRARRAPGNDSNIRAWYLHTRVHSVQ